MADTAKSVVLYQFMNAGEPIVIDYPLPDLSGKIEVDVYYCGLNFCDLYTKLGLFSKNVPFVLGTECCGIITKLGVTTTDFKIGDRVICFNFEGGLFRTTVRVNPNECYHIPDHVTFQEGAAIFVHYLTAYFSVFSIGNIRSNSTVLIKSCVGGVGCAATQLVRTTPGVKICGTLTPGKEEYAKENGVDYIYGCDDFYEKVMLDHPTGFDLILDNQSGWHVNKSMQLLKSFGRLVLLGANSLIKDHNMLISSLSRLKLWWHTSWFSLTNLVVNTTSVSGLHLGVIAAKDRPIIVSALDELFELLKDKKIKPRIDSIWAIEDVMKGINKLGERKNVGKILLSMKNTNQ